jgi:hypothetical protein
MKTEVSPSGQEKFKFGDGFLSFNVKTWTSFYAGTQFKIAKVKLNKHNVEMILVPIPEEGHIGDLELVMPDNYATQPAPELIAHINEMLRLNTLSATAPKKGASTGKVTLDCMYKARMVDPRPVEVVFDEGEQVASFQNVGKPLPMRPAKFTDDLIKWNDGASEQSRTFYTLSRSTGELTELFGDRSNAVSLTCSVRVKKF